MYGVEHQCRPGNDNVSTMHSRAVAAVKSNQLLSHCLRQSYCQGLRQLTRFDSVSVEERCQQVYELGERWVAGHTYSNQSRRPYGHLPHFASQIVAVDQLVLQVSPS